MTRRLLVTGVALAAFALLVVLTRSDDGSDRVGMQSKDSSGSSHEPGPSAGGHELRYGLIDADDRGAIVSDKQARRVLGLNVSGRVIWRDRKAFQDESDVVCLSACPDAAISGSTESFNDPGVADSPIRWRTGGRAVIERRPRAQRKARVLWAGSPVDFVALRGDGRRTLLELRRPAETRRFTVESYDTTFDVARGEKRALAFSVPSEQDGGPEASALRWFERGSGGWRQVGAAHRSHQVGGCFAADGERAVLDGGAPTLIRFGAAKARPLTVRLGQSQDRVTNCAVTAAGVVLAAPAGQDGGGTLVAFVDSAGKQRWSKRFSGVVGSLAVHPNRPEVAVSGEGRLTFLDKDGRRLLEREGVDDAKPLGGRIAIVTHGGRVGRIAYPQG